MAAAEVLPAVAETQSSRRMKSVEASRAVWNSGAKLTRSELLVLQALASHANADFECYPSLDRLAEMSRLSRRQVIRVIHRLRDKKQVAFDDNKGGQKKCNRYRLLVALNGDISNSDIEKSDTRNSDISNTETVTFRADTVTKQHPNGDIAMSPEGVEWFEGQEEWAEHWDSDVTVIRHFEDAVEELDLENETEEGFLARIRLGERLCRTENCSLHGDFVRQGFRCGKWIAWEGVECIYSPGFGYNAGCHGCEEKPGSGTGDCNPNLPIRGAELRSPVFCPTHGSYILTYRLYERPQSWVDLGEDRFDISGDHNSDCPGCDADWMYETNLKHQLELSTEQWERGRDRIIAAIDYAQEVD